MKRRRIGRTSLVVSELCLGTMTFGSTCDEAEAFRILDRAYDAGIDFFDTAEIYPVPPDAKWVHRSEEILGKWLRTKPRDSVYVATKFCGPGHGWFIPPVREGRTGLDRHHIRRAIEGSLRRLQVEWIDLYQTHWPDHDFPYEQTLGALHECVVEGKTRYLGSSNENAWGTMKALAISERNGWSRYESIQNNYSIVHRRFEDELAEVCRREGLSLLPYSPLGGGVLTGKYNVPEPPAESRFMYYSQKGGERQKAMAKRFVNEKSLATTREFLEVAKEADWAPVALALAWSKRLDCVASTIFGANTVAQLEESLAAIDRDLPADLAAKIDAITAKYLYPLG